MENIITVSTIWSTSGKEIIENLIDIKKDGSFKPIKISLITQQLTMINNKFENYLVKKLEKETEKLTQFHMDIASSVQKG